MRRTLRASVLATFVAFSPFLSSASGAGCASRGGHAPIPRPKEPPPPVLVVQLDHVALRNAAWSELHAWLAAAARTSSAPGDPDLDAAANAYAAPLATDVYDEALLDATHRLARCVDERCAREAMRTGPFGVPFDAALGPFLKRAWSERAARAHAAVETVRAVMDPVTDALFVRTARDLAAADPNEVVTVDVVGDAPPAGHDAAIRASLGATSSCFVREKKKSAAGSDDDSLHNARIVDCVIAYASLARPHDGELHDALVSELGARDGLRAWVLIVVHASAFTVTGWQPKHVSVLRRSALAVERGALEWLEKEWPSRVRGEPAASFAKRFAAEARLAPERR